MKKDTHSKRGLKKNKIFSKCIFCQRKTNKTQQSVQLHHSDYPLCYCTQILSLLSRCCLVGLLVCDAVSWYLGCESRYRFVPVEKWGPTCAKPDLRNKLEISLRNSSNNYSSRSDIQWKLLKGKKKKLANITLVFFLLYMFTGWRGAGHLSLKNLSPFS